MEKIITRKWIRVDRKRIQLANVETYFPDAATDIKFVFTSGEIRSVSLEDKEARDNFLEDLDSTVLRND